MLLVEDGAAVLKELPAVFLPREGVDTALDGPDDGVDGEGAVALGEVQLRVVNDRSCRDRAQVHDGQHCLSAQLPNELVVGVVPHAVVSTEGADVEAPGHVHDVLNGPNGVGEVARQPLGVEYVEAVAVVVAADGDEGEALAQACPVVDAHEGRDLEVGPKLRSAGSCVILDACLLVAVHLEVAYGQRLDALVVGESQDLVVELPLDVVLLGVEHAVLVELPRAPGDDGSGQPEAEVAALRCRDQHPARVHVVDRAVALVADDARHALDDVVRSDGLVVGDAPLTDLDGVPMAGDDDLGLVALVPELVQGAVVGLVRARVHDVAALNDAAGALEDDRDGVHGHVLGLVHEETLGSNAPNPVDVVRAEADVHDGAAGEVLLKYPVL